MTEFNPPPVPLTLALKFQYRRAEVVNWLRRARKLGSPMLCVGNKESRVLHWSLINY